MLLHNDIIDEIRSYITFAENSFFWHAVTDSDNNSHKEMHPAIDLLTKLNKDVESCHACALHTSRTRVVFGAGTPHTKIVFVGEAPGEEEDRQGLPFVGKAGALLTRIIDAMGLTREGVYICNAIKCRPPNNRTPTDEEITICRGYLIQQIDIIKPQVIVALGAVSVRALFGSWERITKLRGKFIDYKGIKVMPTFHPSYLLREPSAKKLTWEDMKLVMKELNLPVKNKKGGVK